MRQFCTRIRKAKINKKIKIILKCNKELHPIFWIQASKDGSIYLSPYYKEINRLYKGKTTLKGKSVEVKYTDKIKIDKNSFDNSRMSFHSSGVIHGFHKNSKVYRKPFRDISTREDLCYVLFQHPSTFYRIEKPKKHDIVIDYKYDYNYPLYAHISIAQSEITEPIGYKDAAGQTNIILQYQNLIDSKDISIQLVLYTAKGEWPPDTYVVYPASQVNGFGY